jgi:hypothetical protein
MGKLFNWLAGISAAFVIAYTINTYSFSKVPNGFQVNGPKSNIILTHNNGKSQITNNSIISNGNNIETILGYDHNNSTIFGSSSNITTQDKGIVGEYNFPTKTGTGLYQWTSNMGAVDLDYDSTRTNTFSRWFSRIENLGKNYGWDYKR